MDELDTIVGDEFGLRDVFLRFVSDGVPGLFQPTPPNVKTAVKQGFQNRKENLAKQLGTPEGLVQTVGGVATAQAVPGRQMLNMMGNPTRAIQRGKMVTQDPLNPSSLNVEEVTEFGPLMSRFKKPAQTVQQVAKKKRKTLRQPKGKQGGGQFRGSSFE